MPDGQTLLYELERAVDQSNLANFRDLCERHRDVIVNSFNDWRRVPEAIRDNSEAIERYTGMLIAVAQHFAQEFEDPTLMNTLMRPPQANLLQEWEEMLEAIDEVKAQGSYEDALERMSALLELTQQIQGPQASHAFALVRGRYGEIYYNLGDVENSRKHTELALSACFDDQDFEGVIVYLQNLYQIAMVSNDHEEMEKWSKAAIRITTDLGQFAEASQWLLRLAETQAAQDCWPEAAKTLNEGLRSARSALANDKPQLSVFLNNAAELLRRHDEPKLAQPLYVEAIALRRSAALRDLTLAQFLHNLAFLHQQSDDIKPAGALLEESLAIKRSELPSDGLLIAETLNSLGVYYSTLGDAARARDFYAEALRLRTAQTENEVSDQGTTLSNWVELELKVGNDPTAKALLDQLEEAVPVAEDDTARFSRLSRVASLYERLGNYEMAAKLMSDVADFIDRVIGKDSPNYARALAALANVKAGQNKTEEAEELFHDAIERMRKGSGFEPEDLSTVLNNLGLMYFYLAKNDEAEKLLVEVLEQRQSNLEADDPKRLDSLNNLGLVYTAQQRYAKAESVLREVLEKRRKVLIPDHPNIAQSMFNLGMLYKEMGRTDEALPLLKEQFEGEDRLLANVLSVTSENERLAYAAKLRDNLNILLMQMIDWKDRPDAIRIAFEAVLRRKGIVAEAGGKDRSAIRTGQNALAHKLLEELNEVRRRLARGILDGPTGDAAVHEVELSSLARKREQLEAKLARELGSAGGPSPIQADTRTVADALHPDSALLEFAKFELTSTGVSQYQGLEAYVVFVLLSGQPEALTLHQLGLAKTMDPSVELFRAVITRDVETLGRLRDISNVHVQNIDFAATEIGIGTELTRVLVDRIRPALGSRKRLFVVPDGILNRLPFETLPGEDGARIGEEFEISYLSSGRDLLRFNSAPQHESGPVLVVADPDFNLESSVEPVVPASTVKSRSRRSMSVRFEPLPDTKTEGEWVASRLGVVPWSGAEALEAKVKDCESPRILHLATHGFFLPRNPQREVDSPSRVNEVVSQPLDNPLLRSGLALAGANRWLDGHSLPIEAEDGLLTAEDVCAMNLLGTELVVLSACDTGLGEYRSGEGVFGLRRAFELAGARSLIMSLWRVPSGPTRELMQEFYRQLSLGKRRSQALREAQRILRRRYPETFYWGAFVLSGDPSPLQL